MSGQIEGFDKKRFLPVAVWRQIKVTRAANSIGTTSTHHLAPGLSLNLILIFSLTNVVLKHNATFIHKVPFLWLSLTLSHPGGHFYKQSQTAKGNSH